MSRIFLYTRVDGVDFTGFKIVILLASRTDNKISTAAYQSSVNSLKGFFQVDNALFGLPTTGRSCLFGLSKI